VLTGKVDRYGRKLKKDKRIVDDLKAFYSVDDEVEGEDEEGKCLRSLAFSLC